MSEQTPRIVVIGGGYAGVLAANRLRRRPGLDITLVNPRPQFVERIRLHQLAVGNDDATEPYEDMLGEGIRLVVDGATRIDAAARQVELASGATLDYDYLIYAVGSTGAVTAAVPGAAEFGYPLSELEQAQRLADRLRDVPAIAPVVVVGGGLTGVEAAAELAEAGRPVTLVTDQLTPSLAATGRKSVAKTLDKLGVHVIEGVTVARVHAHSVELSHGTTLPSAVTLWTAGFGVPGLAAASGLSTDELGRVLTDETLTSVDDERIVAAGDAAAPSGLPLRMSCAAAMPLGAQAAHTVLARLAGDAAAPISLAFAGQCISLGRKFGTMQLLHTDDSPRRGYVGGRTAAAIKELICSTTVWALRREARKPGSYFWVKGNWRADRLARAEQPVPAP
ncbi:dehydrogenase [Mycolicibacterium chitae]|uniref:FAD-dependent pyridine nucleotide-disulfide oxidoreductase n=1 Tax=Mycolicibacterium chitae TaxID=1792 RepID=A0A448I0P8_MYCCI|nr:FAD-dependent oxidoreductase [Mycolicibacterium chitae]MCV7108072.1 FAD-dependent oxidoreductase [Mycolicibacterium chitae]BBZ02961.1 dehydrogenase [Mycolicibacterium chitae]VEG46030.1 FAD-dependent pyridine nucleotide-disulfide oxidoreductase [Mycolicibacterium chitae]